jgi:hypothetical protein
MIGTNLILNHHVLSLAASPWRLIQVVVGESQHSRKVVGAQPP